MFIALWGYSYSWSFFQVVRIPVTLIRTGQRRLHRLAQRLHLRGVQLLATALLDALAAHPSPSLPPAVLLLFVFFFSLFP